MKRSLTLYSGDGCFCFLMSRGVLVGSVEESNVTVGLHPHACRTREENTTASTIPTNTTTPPTTPPITAGISFAAKDRPLAAMPVVVLVVVAIVVKPLLPLLVVMTIEGRAEATAEANNGLAA